MWAFTVSPDAIDTDQIHCLIEYCNPSKTQYLGVLKIIELTILTKRRLCTMYHQRKLGGLSLKTQGNIYFQINKIICKNTFTIS